MKWIEQFLTNRKQFVTVNGFHSMLALVLSGVPQGSVLGLILFLVYINDIQCHLKGSTAGSFADDTRISTQISSSDDVLILQENLSTVVKWATENNMPPPPRYDKGDGNKCPPPPRMIRETVTSAPPPPAMIRETVTSAPPPPPAMIRDTVTSAPPPAMIRETVTSPPPAL